MQKTCTLFFVFLTALLFSLGLSDTYAVKDYALDQNELTIGTRIGTSANTMMADDVYEIITEIPYRHFYWFWPTKLVHRWVFNVTGGDTTTLYLEGHCGTVNNYTEDFYAVSFSTEANSHRRHLFTINQGIDAVYKAEMPYGLSGIVYIYVEDTDRAITHSTKNSVFIDQIYMESVVNFTQATHPTPHNGAIDVGTDGFLTWSSASRLAIHDVYIGTAYSLVNVAHVGSAEYQGRQVASHFALSGAIFSNVAYFWRVDEVVSGVICKGQVWSFTVYPIPTASYPPNNSVTTYREPVLSWKTHSGLAALYMVYFGGKRDDTESSCFLNTTRTWFEPGTLELNHWYFWKIDEIDQFGEVHHGSIWSFYVPGLKDDVPTGMDPAVGGSSRYHRIVHIDDCMNNSSFQVINYRSMNPPFLKESFVRSSEATCFVTWDALSLLDALQNRAMYGDIVYIPGNITIDLSGYRIIGIPPGVTLASNRGVKGNNSFVQGALIYVDDFEDENGLNNQALFHISSSSVRMTGLRIRGPLHNATNTNRNQRIGIQLTNECNCEIDNCELSHFGQEAIAVICSPSSRPLIHHNYLHDSRNSGNFFQPGVKRLSYGYGIFLASGFPDVFANVFERLSHSIAGNGKVGCSYEARYNILLSGLRSLTATDAIASFDMHGRIGDFDGAGFCHNNPIFRPNCRAGSQVLIHHNTFSWTIQRVRGFAISIRGRPRDYSRIYNNWFFHGTVDEAVRQTYRSGHLNVSANVVGFPEFRAQETWKDYYPNQPPY